MRARSLGHRWTSETARLLNVTHGESNRTAEYAAWTKMLSRCFNPHVARFESWGGRGITVCPEWRESYQQFLADMGRKPSADHQLDRIDNDKNYEPSNCRWATRAEQARNRRSTLLVTFNGRTQCVTDWAHELGLQPKTLNYRIKSGWPVERALAGIAK